MFEVTVKRYACDHCGKRWASKSRTAEHEAECWRNPAQKSCGTCMNFSEAARVCEAGEFDFTEPTPEGAKHKLPRNCPEWRDWLEVADAEAA